MFIALTDPDGDGLLLNLDSIEAIWPNKEGGCTVRMRDLLPNLEGQLGARLHDVRESEEDIRLALDNARWVIPVVGRLPQVHDL